MAITFLKSIWANFAKNTRVRGKSKNSEPEIKSFKENQEKEEAFDKIHRGIKQISLDRIVGSVGRYHDFDSTFRLKQHLPHDRLNKIKQIMKDGKSLPPIKVYQIKNEYYVLDGNHRVSAAKELGRQDIDARIVELLPSANTLENMIYREKVDFSDKTGLSYSIELTEISQYDYLLTQILQHKRVLAKETKNPVSLKEAALDWHKTIYHPLTVIIQKGNLIRSFPGRTIADLYIYISFHQWEKRAARKYGIGVDRLIPRKMEEFRKKMANKNEAEYPDMQREITAFILINVKAGREIRIIDKLFNLDEVRELHSIHGNIDIIAKIILKRDLLASDSEIIAHFVDRYVRRISGIASTQTLIPGYSKIKEQ